MSGYVKKIQFKLHESYGNPLRGMLQLLVHHIHNYKNSQQQLIERERDREREREREPH